MSATPIHINNGLSKFEIAEAPSLIQDTISQKIIKCIFGNRGVFYTIPAYLVGIKVNPKHTLLVISGLTLASFVADKILNNLNNKSSLRDLEAYSTSLDCVLKFHADLLISLNSDYLNENPFNANPSEAMNTCQDLKKLISIKLKTIKEYECELTKKIPAAPIT